MKLILFMSKLYLVWVILKLSPEILVEEQDGALLH